MNTAQKSHKHRGSTQRFTEIEDIIDNVVLITGNQACSIIEVQAINFALLSQEEQNARIASYASLLNSLSFYIQIVMRSKQVDISSYLTHIDEATKKTTNQKLLTYITQYKEFVQNMIKVNSILDKKFYIVIPYSSLEKGASTMMQKGDFSQQAKAALQSKTDTVIQQLARMSLRSKVLTKEDLIKVFYEIYNHELQIPMQEDTGTGHTVVQGAHK